MENSRRRFLTDRFSQRFPKNLYPQKRFHGFLYTAVRCQTPAVWPDMAVKAPQNDKFPTGFMRVSASGAKGWEMINFIQGLPRFWNALWVLLTKMAWSTFNLDHVLVGFQ